MITRGNGLGCFLFILKGVIFMAKQKVKLDNDTTAMFKVLCEYHGLDPENLIVKLVTDEWNRNYKDIIRKGFA